MTLLAAPRARAGVLLLALLSHLPRTSALSPEETAGLQGMCDLNAGGDPGRASGRICEALEAGQDPCCYQPKLSSYMVALLYNKRVHMTRKKRAGLRGGKSVRRA